MSDRVLLLVNITMCAVCAGMFADGRDPVDLSLAIATGFGALALIARGT